MHRDKLIERVKKLMAMAADGSSPNEALIAARRARKLMDKHQLSIEDLTDRSPFSVHKSSDARRFTPYWENIISVAVAKYNDCLAGFEHVGGTNAGAYYRLSFKGFEEDVKVASYMFVYLVENGKRQCSRYMRDNGYGRYNARIGTSFKDAYALEIVSRFQSMIAERVEESEGTGLMVIKQQLVEKEFGNPEYGKGRDRKRAEDDMAAASEGQKVGRNTPINSALETEQKVEIGGG